MASLLDFLNAGGGGLLGNFGGRFPEPDPTDELQRIRQQMYGSGGGSPAPGRTLTGPTELPPFGQGPSYLGSDPFNFLMPQQPPDMAGSAPAPTAPAASPPSWLAPSNLAPVAGSAPAPTAPPSPGGMPVSLASPPASLAPPASAVAPQAAEPSFGSRVNDFLANNPATLMALGGGIARHGIGGGFLDAAPIAAVEQKQATTQKNQMLAAVAIRDALVAKGHSLKEATGMALAAAVNPAVAQSILPEALGTQKPSGTIQIGNMHIPYMMDGKNGPARLILPGGQGINSMDDLVKYGQDIEAQGAAAKTKAETTAKAQAEAGQALPDTLAGVDKTLKEINQLRTHPGKSLATGPVAGALPALGGSQADYVARLDQLAAEATQMAINANKGGGMRLTNAEVMSLKNVAARLNRRGDIDTALKDFAETVKGVRERAGVKAGVGPTPAAATEPSWTTLPNGVRYRQVQ